VPGRRYGTAPAPSVTRPEEHADDHHAPGRRLGDRAFHTLHADLHAVGGAPLQSGFVNDVHTNGVVNGAHQIYHLNGASPNTTYAVTINLYLGDPTCTTAPIAIRPPRSRRTARGTGTAGSRSRPGRPPRSS
jgi:hypothetical protein